VVRLNGVDFIPAMIVLFGISEVIRNVIGGEIAYLIVGAEKKN
jgi:hypothetical protein